ncbi:MAG TPA: hypothetical protein PKE45_25515 [Caldilineaceae bacterium]|nr:hypothetical protein [Caldilineaceae bacterium]
MNPATTLRAEDASLEQHRRWAWRLAYWVSHIASPPVLASAAILLVAAYLATAQAWYWAVIDLLLAVGVPCLYIFWLVVSGRLADFHLPIRQQRAGPLLCTALLTSMGWLVLWLGYAPRLLQSVACVHAVQAWLFLLITFYWKISLHSAAAANLALLGLVLLGSLALPLITLVLLVGWARVYLRRHTVAQTVAGVVLGTLVMGGACLLY